MKKPFKKGVGVLLMLTLAACLACPAYGEGAAPEESKVRGILYRVWDGASTAYVLGSIHIGNQEMYPFGPRIQEAMAQADTFVFECDTTTMKAQADTMGMMYLQNGARLEELVSPECYEKLRQVCQLKGYLLGSFATMRPWAVMSLLSFDLAAAELGMEDLRAAQALGVETQVRAFVQREKKALAYLETTREQLETLDGFSLELQRYMLEQTLDVIVDPSTAKGIDADMASWPGLWREGDAQAFADRYWAGYEEEERQDLIREYQNKLMTQRNLHMADRLQAMMKENPGTYFVTVGLLHVVLPGDSVVEHMREKGYQVEFLSGR